MCQRLRLDLDHHRLMLYAAEAKARSLRQVTVIVISVLYYSGTAQVAATISTDRDILHYNSSLALRSLPAYSVWRKDARTLISEKLKTFSFVNNAQ